MQKTALFVLTFGRRRRFARHRLKSRIRFRLYLSKYTGYAGYRGYDGGIAVGANRALCVQMQDAASLARPCARDSGHTDVPAWTRHVSVPRLIYRDWKATFPRSRKMRWRLGNKGWPN